MLTNAQRHRGAVLGCQKKKRQPTNLQHFHFETVTDGSSFQRIWDYSEFCILYLDLQQNIIISRIIIIVSLIFSLDKQVI